VLEMLVLVGLCKGMDALMRSKGHNPLVLQILAVVGWIGGEIAGAVFGVIYFAIAHPGQEPGLLIYLFALGGAVLGGGFPFLIGLVIPARYNPPEIPYMPLVNQPARPFDPTNPYDSSNPYDQNPFAPR
jgi:hypothetical protein